MKKIRIILGASALVLAGAVTYAHSYSPFAFVNAYRYVASSGTCQLVNNVCTDDGTIACTITIGTTIHPLGASTVPVGTTCGTQLKMPKP